MNGIRNTAIAYLYLVKIYLLTRYKKKENFWLESGGCLVFCLSIKSRDQVDAIYVYQFTSPNCLHYVKRIEWKWHKGRISALDWVAVLGCHSFTSIQDLFSVHGFWTFVIYALDLYFVLDVYSLYTQVTLLFFL